MTEGMIPMKAKQLYTAAIIVLLLCLACIFASAETRTAAPYVYEILDEENKTAQIVRYAPMQKGW